MANPQFDTFDAALEACTSFINTALSSVDSSNLPLSPICGPKLKLIDGNGDLIHGQLMCRLCGLLSSFCKPAKSSLLVSTNADSAGWLGGLCERVSRGASEVSGGVYKGVFG